MAVSATIVCRVDCRQTLTGHSSATPRIDGARFPAGQASHTIASGTAAGQASKQWNSTISLAASTPQDLDLRALATAGGGTVQLATLRMIYVRTKSADPTEKVTVGLPGGSNDFAFGGLLDSGEALETYGGMVPILLGWAAGITVDATHKDMRLDPGSDAQDVEIILVGT